jgi:hypothetical protein
VGFFWNIRRRIRIEAIDIRTVRGQGIKHIWLKSVVMGFQDTMRVKRPHSWLWWQCLVTWGVLHIGGCWEAQELEVPLNI